MNPVSMRARVVSFIIDMTRFDQICVADKIKYALLIT
jgi:hypothetical protein